MECTNCVIEDLSTNLIQMAEISDPRLEPNIDETEMETSFSVVKYTVAGERGSHYAMKFLNQYMKMEPREDTPWGNLMMCEGAPVSFVARNDLVQEGAGTCTLITSFGGSSEVSLSKATPETVGIALGEEVFYDCIFMDNTSFYLGSEATSYNIQASSKRQCCLACQGDPDCIGSNYVQGTRTEPYIGFGAHVPTSSARSTGEALNVSAVEQIVSDKLGDMKRFDAWLDYSLGLWTTDLDSYIRVFNSDGVPYLGAEWTTGDTHVFSLFVWVKGSQMILELMATNSTEFQDRKDLVSLEPRLPEFFVLHLIELNLSANVLKEARISRATTDLDALDFFYIEGMRIRPSFNYETDNVGVHCYEWAMGTPQICYTKRAESKTKGWFTVATFEKMLKVAAAQSAGNSLCNKNRWFDNHYSVTADGISDPSIHNYIIDHLDAHSEVPIACNPTAGLYYILDPSGWAVQMPSGIGTRLPNRCGGGSRSVDIYENTTAEFVFCELGSCS